jgi:hypothetical protein
MGLRGAAVALAFAWAAGGGQEVPRFPRVEVIPQPDQEFSFRLDGREVLRYLAGPSQPKPYFYPVVGPCGRPVTRITHPRDPHTHSHHLSLWIGHQDAGGNDFWEHFKSPARIVHDRVERIDDGDTGSLAIHARWLDGERKLVLLDRRVWTFSPIHDTVGPNGFGEFFLDLHLTLASAGGSVTLGKTNFGLLAVRVAKTMGANDGGGRITNSEGKEGEKDVLWQRARWCDTSGPAAPGGVVNGIAIFDHPKNPRHPASFHVRSDGWMGAQVTREEALDMTKETPLVLRYRLWVHAGACDPKKTDALWKRWAERE